MFARIRKWFPITALFWILLALIAQPLKAQVVLWADRGDRFEGVITTKNVSGGLLNLLGAQLTAPGQLIQSATNLYVTFKLPAPAIVTLKVWEPDTNYWMVPKQKKFQTGIQSFNWPVIPVLKGLDINFTKLRVLVIDANNDIYYPAQLSSNLHQADPKHYRFTFESKGGFELKGNILRQIGNTMTPVRSFEFQEDYPGNLEMVWDGLDHNGKPVPPGIMYLQLEGLLYLASRDANINFELQFWHTE